MTAKAKSKRPRQPAPPQSAPGDTALRLQKVLAAAGHGSRRACEQLILEGRVEVDRQVVTEMGTKVAPADQEVRVDGEPIRKVKRQYFLVNKPKGVVSTNRDPAGRPRVIDLVPIHAERCFHVGRLDLASEGLILVTNDGPLANQLTHPRYAVEKTYVVQVAGHVQPDVVRKLRQGMRLAEGMARVDKVRIKRRHKQSTILEMVLSEGRNREIRRLFARLGHKVQFLKRIAIGPLRLGDLPPGQYREATSAEVRALRLASRGEETATRTVRSGPRS